MAYRPLPTGIRAVQVLAVTMLLGTVVAAPSTARVLQISFTPDAPTWRDAVVVTVKGSGLYCSPELEQPVLSFAGVWWIDIDLVDHCTTHPPSEGPPFSVSTTLEPVGPRVAYVRVHDVADGGDVATASLTIHSHADLVIKAVEPARSFHPLQFTLEGVAACPQAEVTSVVSAGGGLPIIPSTPGKVRVIYHDGCPILPPPEHRFTLDLEAASTQIDGGLEAGEYEIQVFDVTDGPELPPAVTTRVMVWDISLCTPTATSHCLERTRFEVKASFRDFAGRTGDARAIPTGLDDTGLFWFFNPDNVELTVKVLNGCGNNGYFWVFIASGSTVEYEVDVIDTYIGRARSYRNELGHVPELIADTTAFRCTIR
jgi:hypothetical protein